jgi:hypothetical protein
MPSVGGGGMGVGVGVFVGGGVFVGVFVGGGFLAKTSPGGEASVNSATADIAIAMPKSIRTIFFSSIFPPFPHRSSVFHYTPKTTLFVLGIRPTYVLDGDEW